jgi:hypothetical protein
MSPKSQFSALHNYRYFRIVSNRRIRHKKKNLVEPTLSFTHVEKLYFFAFSHGIASLQCFIFLTSVNCDIFSILDNICRNFQEKSLVYQLSISFAWNLILIRQMMRIRPDPDPDPQHWTVKESTTGTYFHTNLDVSITQSRLSLEVGRLRHRPELVN